MTKKEKKKNNWLFTLFACVATAFIVFMAMNLGDKAGKLVCPPSNNFNEPPTNNYSVDKLKGAYLTTLTSKCGEDCSEKITYSLEVYEDGTFTFYRTSKSKDYVTKLGNYVIDNDNIIFYSNFIYKNGMYYYTDDKATITFEDDNTINYKDSDEDVTLSRIKSEDSLKVNGYYAGIRKILAERK